MRKVNFRAVISFGFMLAIGLAIAVGLLASAAPEANAQATGDPVKGLQVLQANGCVRCHGDQLTSNTAPRLAGTSLTYEQFLAKVRSGGGRMPPFPASAVSDDDVRNAYAYARSLSAAPAGQATTAAATTAAATTAAAGATTAATATTAAATTTAARTTAAVTTTVAAATTAARTTVAGQGGSTGVPATGVGSMSEAGNGFSVLWLALPLLVIVGMSGVAIVTRRRSR